eukprot:RCo010705
MAAHRADNGPGEEAPDSTWEEEAICSVCMELLDDPVILDCGHNNCMNCVVQLYAFEGKCTAASSAAEPLKPDAVISSSAAATGATETISCPECRHLTAVPPSGIQDLKRNLTLRNLVSRLKAERRRPEQVLCGVCEAEEAAFECQQCGFELCRGCRDTQHQRGRFKQHNVVPLGQLERVRPRPCPAHKKDLDLFCTEDQCAVCIYCLQLGPHTRHQVVALADAVSDANKEIGSAMVVVREQVTELQAAETKADDILPKIDQESSTVSEQVASYFRSLTELLVTRQQELQAEIEAARATAVGRLTSQKDRLRSVAEQLGGTLQSCERFLADSSGTDLLRSKAKVLNRLKSLTEVPFPQVTAEPLGFEFVACTEMEELLRTLECVRRVVPLEAAGQGLGSRGPTGVSDAPLRRTTRSSLARGAGALLPEPSQSSSAVFNPLSSLDDMVKLSFLNSQAPVESTPVIRLEPADPLLQSTARDAPAAGAGRKRKR